MPSTGGRSRAGSFDRYADIRPKLRRAYEYDPEAFLGGSRRGLPRTLRNAAGQLIDRVPILPNFAPPPSFRNLDSVWRDPFGGDWRISPLDPVSPTDCARFANSPYCGGSGIQLDPLDVELSFSGSHQCVTVTPSLFFVSLPSFTACRITEYDPIVDPPPGINPDVWRTINSLEAGDYDGLADAFMHIVESYAYKEIRHYYVTPYGRTLINREFSAYKPSLEERMWCFKTSGRQWSNGILAGYTLESGSPPFLEGDSFEGVENPGIEIDGDFVLTLDERPEKQELGVISVANPYGVYTINISFLSRERKEFIIRYLSEPEFQVLPPFLRNVYEIFISSRFPINTPPPIFPPLTPTPPMSCCEESADNNELLKRIAKAIGGFPVQVPETFIDPEQGFFQDLFAKKTTDKRTIENLRDLSGWLAETIHDVLGGFHQVVEIQDADLTTDGNQTEKIVLPNIAETLTELIQITFQANRNTQALISLGMRTLLEAGLARKEAIVGQSYAKANAEFLSYNGREVALDVPFSFKLPSKEQIDGNSDDLEDLAKLLKESTIKVKAWEFKDDDRTLQFFLTDLLQAAAIIKAINFQRLNPNGDMGDQIMNLYRFYKNFTEEDEENRPSNDGEERPSKFQQFLEKVERGFIDSTGAGNNTEPYGRNYRERPRIREIGIESGTISGNAGGGNSGGGNSGGGSGSGNI